MADELGIPYPKWSKGEKDILGGDFAGAGGKNNNGGKKKRAKSARKLTGSKRVVDKDLDVEKGFL